MAARSPALPASPGLMARAVRASRTSARASAFTRRSSAAARTSVDLQDRQESLLRQLDGPDGLHPLLALFLLVEELLLARDVAAVALRGDVLADRLDRRPRDHAAADRGLDRDVEHLARHHVLHLRAQLDTAVIRGIAVRDDRERVDALAVDQHVEPDQIGVAIA